MFFFFSNLFLFCISVVVVVQTKVKDRPLRLYAFYMVFCFKLNNRWFLAFFVLFTEWYLILMNFLQLPYNI